MLQPTKQLYGKKLVATDGEIGHVKDFYFDDQSWAIRYLVADTGSWLSERLVLIAPHAFDQLDEQEHQLHVKLSRARIEQSPSIETHRPVSRQYEEDYYRYYGWPMYWQGGDIWGTGGVPIMMPVPVPVVPPLESAKPVEPHLRSTQAITGYDIETLDGAIGHVSGFMLDDRKWSIADMTVKTSSWFSGKEVLIAPNRIDRISDAESKVYLRLTKADIQRTTEHEVAQFGPAELRD